LDASLSFRGIPLVCREGRRSFFIEATGSRGKRSIGLNIAPLIISEKMQKGVFDPMETVILTSATLAIGDSFRYFRQPLWGTKGGRLQVQEAFSPAPLITKTGSY
jgi:Rad3-related DNA helicase